MIIILSILKQKLIYLGFSKNANMEMLIRFDKNPNQEMNGVITVKHLNPATISLREQNDKQWQITLMFIIQARNFSL